MSNADQFRERIEAYALGALEPDERAAVATHLAEGCSDCEKALDEAQWLVSQLAYLAPDAQPSDLLRGRLLKTVRAEAATAKTPSRSATKSAIPFWTWAAVAAVLLFALYNAYEARVLQQRVHEMQAALTEQTHLQEQSAQQLALAHREAVILTDPRSVRIVLPAVAKDLPALQATWHAALGIVVSGQNLPLPAGKRTLQLWLIPKTPGGKPIPSQTLRPADGGKFDLLVAHPPGSQIETKALAITEEPEGGSEQPTTAPLWVGALGS